MNSKIYLPIDELISENNRISLSFEKELTELTIKYSKLEKENSENEFLRKWYNLSNDIYAVRRRIISDYLHGPTINDRSLTEFQYQRQIGSRYFPLIIDFTSASELMIRLLGMNSRILKAKLKDSTYPLKISLKEKWTEENPKLKNEINELLGLKRNTFANLRKVLKEEKYISPADADFLSNIWTLRNQVHSNYIAVQDIDFSFFPIQSRYIRNYFVSKGNPLIVPRWSLTLITERLVSVFCHLFQNIPDLITTSINDI